MAAVVHVCPRGGETRATGHCGSCAVSTIPCCSSCGHDLTQPGHPETC